ncbi:MAG: ArgE/DapE family deacylase [Bryobacteraceae bacterium]|nr:ArgE/DapE family deacylase [Bryobacteraceae bacterium]
MKLDREHLFRTLSELVRINSINPTLVAGGAGEREIGTYIAGWMKSLPVRVETFEPEPGRVSVLATLPGSGQGPALMLNAHVDTVGVEGMPEPFSGAIRDGRLYGRGAYDMKGSLAACMAALKTIADAGVKLGGDLMVAAVADEEYGSLGTADLVTRVKPDAAIVTEPTANRVCLAHKGYAWIEVETHGRAAHGSKFELGIDANMRMGRFLARLDQLEQELRSRTPHALVGPPSLHAAMLQGGEGLSTYSPGCVLKIERRTIPGEGEAQVMTEIQAILDRLSAADPTFHASARCFFFRDAFEVSREAGIVRTLAGCAASRLGREPEYFGDTPWMDSALTSGAGIETVVFGPGGAGAHAIEEWVDLESVAATAEILAATAMEYCGVRGHPAHGA